MNLNWANFKLTYWMQLSNGQLIQFEFDVFIPNHMRMFFAYTIQSYFAPSKITPNKLFQYFGRLNGDIQPDDAQFFWHWIATRTLNAERRTIRRGRKRRKRTRKKYIIWLWSERTTFSTSLLLLFIFCKKMYDDRQSCQSHCSPWKIPF